MYPAAASWGPSQLALQPFEAAGLAWHTRCGMVSHGVAAVPAPWRRCRVRAEIFVTRLLCLCNVWIVLPLLVIFLAEIINVN